MYCLPLVFCLALLLLTGHDSFAVLFRDTGDPTYNTSAPTGALTNSGWQYEGQWQSIFLGTPIAPHYFLAAQHIGGSVGNVFTWNGANYTTTWYTNSPDSDLRIWQVAEAFPSYAPLYTNTNAAGQLMVVIGRGTQRGGPVVVNGTTNGWYWGTADYVQRWGENTVAASSNPFLYALFSETGVTNTCDVSKGDSSGGVFIQQGGVWVLAGIIYGVDVVDTTNCVVTNAAMLDQRGTCLYSTNYPSPIPSGFTASSVANDLNWINSVINPVRIQTNQAGGNLFYQNGLPTNGNVTVALNNPQNMSGGNSVINLDGSSCGYPAGCTGSPVLDNNPSTVWNAGTFSGGGMCNVGITLGSYNSDESSFNVAPGGFPEIVKIRIWATNTRNTDGSWWITFPQQVEIAYTTVNFTGVGNGDSYNSGTLGVMPATWPNLVPITAVNGGAPIPGTGAYSTAGGGDPDWVELPQSVWTGGLTYLSISQQLAYVDLAVNIPAGATSVGISFGQDNSGTSDPGGLSIADIQAFAPPNPFQITSLALSGNDVNLAWATTGGTTNVVQAANGNLNNGFVDISSNLVIPGSGMVTNTYTDIGGATNASARFYRVRVAP